MAHPERWGAKLGYHSRAISSRSTRILVVDDHEGTRDFTCSVLQNAGFAVLSCASGEEALVTIAQDPSIGLLITDIMMPGRLDGWRLAESSKALRGGLRVIYITAGASVIPSQSQGPGLGPLVPKPCTPEQLIISVQRMFGLSPGPRRRN
jgi:CheY-like chemotaxis protein